MVPELYNEIIQWALRQGARKVTGLWTGNAGAYEVKINGALEPIENVPPGEAMIFRDGLPIACIGMAGGSILHSAEPGENENGLIEHFKAA